MTVALLFPGQGTQHGAMLPWLEASDAARPVLARMAAALGVDWRARLSDTAWSQSNAVAQVLVTGASVAAWTALASGLSRVVAVAGYSVGELAAWGCSGAVDGACILSLAQRRAAMMDAVAPRDSGLAAIVGLRRPTLEPILARHALSIAIIDEVDTFVVGGLSADLEAACEEAAARGARRTVSLRVAVPSHTPLLVGATEQFRAILRESSPRLPSAGYRLLSGIDGDTIHDMETGIDKLARQISTTIDWAACLESCRSAGAETALELGPGTALSRMASALFPGGRARAVEEFRTVAGLRAWLQRAID